jgi:hypothetical protein
MTKPKPLTISQLSLDTGVSWATIIRAIYSGELVAVKQEKQDRRGRPKWIIDRASAAQYKKNHKK